MANTSNSENTTTYGDMVKKEKIAPMINLYPNDPFDIVSENEDGLVMVHHRADADLNVFGNLRGVVVDTNTGTLISHSYPHTPRCVSSSVQEVLNTLNLTEQDVHLKTGFEGTLIHVFKHGGKVYRSTRKRLDPSRSRWGNSKTFGEMYWDLSGPSDDDLFNPEKDYSPFCHSFIMVHPDVLIATKDDVGSGYLVYLGPKQMYSTDPNSCPYPIDKVDAEIRVPETTNTMNPSQKFIYKPENLTLEEANSHLLFGFYDEFPGYEYLDYRLLPGEFVILENKTTGQMYRVESPSYFWRTEVRNNNPNLLHRFFELLDFTYLKNTPEDAKRYFDKFPILSFYKKDHLASTIEKNPIIVWPQNTENELAIPSTKEDKLYNIWQNFLICVPLGKQKEVFTFLDQLQEKREELISWLIETSESSKPLTEFSKRTKDILIKTKDFAISRFNKGKNLDYRTKVFKDIKTMTRDNIRNFIGKEKGCSLYRLIREMDKLKVENV